MDEKATALIGLLGTRNGMIMEDTNETALTLGGMEQAELGPPIDNPRGGSHSSSRTACLFSYDSIIIEL
jgi:hypothetical protein